MPLLEVIDLSIPPIQDAVEENPGEGDAIGEVVMEEGDQAVPPINIVEETAPTSEIPPPTSSTDPNLGVFQIAQAAVEKAEEAYKASKAPHNIKPSVAIQPATPDSAPRRAVGKALYRSLTIYICSLPKYCRVPTSSDGGGFLPVSVNRYWNPRNSSKPDDEDVYWKPRIGAETVNALRSGSTGNAWSHSLFSLIPSWRRRTVFKRSSSVNQPQHRDAALFSGNGGIFWKCATVNNEEDVQTAVISLLINNTLLSPSSVNMSNLILLDNVTGLIVQDVSYNSTRAVNGIQTFRKESLKAGEYFLIKYNASLNSSHAREGLKISLSAQLTFHNSSVVTADPSSFMLAPFTITAKEKLKEVSNHAVHGAGFVIAFIASFALAFAVFFILYYTKKLPWVFLGNSHAINCEQNPGQSQTHLPDNVNEDFIVADKLIDILAFEEPENMLQALEDSEIVNMTQADSQLELWRMHIYKDIIVILLRNITDTIRLPPHEGKRLTKAMSESWVNLEKRIQEEHQRNVIALTAECHLDTRKQMDMQQRKQKAVYEEAEEIMKHVGEKSFTEYRLLLEKLHNLEQAGLKRLLFFKQEEEFAKAERQLTVHHRVELHNIFFDQIYVSVSKGIIKTDVQMALIENYLKVQEEAEELLDFMQANKKFHMSRRLAIRKNIIYNMQLCDSRSRCLLNSAATQIANLINKTERAGHMSESQSGLLLEKAQSEVLRVKQKLENVLKLEKQKLHHKLATKRKRQLVQKLKEHKKELNSVQDVFTTTSEVQPYFEHWKKLSSNQFREVEELLEKHDNDAIEEFKVLKHSLTEKAIEDLEHIQNAVIMQEMLRLHVSRLHLQQVIEEHKRETALLVQQLEKEETDKASEARTSLENTRRKLDEEFKLGIKEQKNLRLWEQLLFTKIILLPLSVSDEDILKIMQEFQCGFSQMDITLALPKIQGRMLLQTYLTEWRNEELLKVDRHFPEFEKQANPKMKKHPPDRNVELLKKYVEDKILIYETQITDDKIKQARAEMLLQRVHQLKTREFKLGEYIASLQFQFINNKSKVLEIHVAILRLQSLLLEEMCRSHLAAKSEYEQLLETQSNEIREIDQNMEMWTPKETVIDVLEEDDRCHGTTEVKESREDPDMPLSSTLRMALKRRKYITNQYRDRMQKEELEYALNEYQDENTHMEARHRLYNQDIRLAAYLNKRTKLPEGILRRVLNLLLPSSSENEILSLLYSVGHKYSDNVTETDSNEDEADSWRKRKHHDLWTDLEKRLREGLLNQEQERGAFTGKKKRSILKKKRLRPVKRVSFSHTENLSNLLQSCGRSETLGSMEAIDLPEVGEKLFIFRAPSESPVPSTSRQKKRNFLNYKKSSTSHA
ncbi:limbin [Rhinophrynus dorsalis]